jgi:hypothetical protein
MSYPHKQYDRFTASYSNTIGPTVLTPPAGHRLILGKVTLINRHNAVANVGFGYQIPNSAFQVFSFTNSGSVATAVTGVAQGTTANAWTIVSTTTTDGFIVQSAERFNGFGFTLGANANAAGTVTYNFSNGTAFSATNVTPIAVMAVNGTNNTYTTAIFAGSEDWAPGCGVTNTANSAWQCLVTFTGGYSRAPLGSGFKLFRLINQYPVLPVNTAVTEDFGGGEFILPKNASAIPFFSVANVLNQVQIDYRCRTS